MSIIYITVYLKKKKNVTNKKYDWNVNFSSLWQASASDKNKVTRINLDEPYNVPLKAKKIRFYHWKRQNN